MKRLTALSAAAAMAGVCIPAFALDEIETRAHYSTNAGEAVGKYVTTAPATLGDWSEDLIISTCGANDMATAFKGSHENNVLDTYALYAAWDEKNLYIAWQMCNTGDVWAREGDGPLTDYGHIGDVPLIVALSVDPSSPCMSGKLSNGNFIWGDNGANGVAFQSHVDHLLFMSGKPGSGEPAMFTAANAQGDTDYGAHCKTFRTNGISYTLTHGFAPSHLWRQNTTADWLSPTELVSDPSVVNNIYDAECYDNLMEGTPEGLKPHSTEYDSFYQITIPFSTLGINREWLEANGIGCRVVATRGESGIDCIPFDPSMMDNALGEYGKDPSTTHEKDDIDVITYALANIGKMRSGQVSPLPDPTPGPDPDPNPNPNPDPQPVDGNYVIYFDNSTSNWSTVYTWVWDNDNTSLNFTGGQWPGAAMTLDADTGYWRYSFTCDKENAKLMCIFNNQGAPQTDDFTLVNHGLYDSNGYVRTIQSTGVESIATPDEGEVLYFNLQGQRVANPEKGLYIRVTSAGSQKVIR